MTPCFPLALRCASFVLAFTLCWHPGVAFSPSRPLRTRATAIPTTTNSATATDRSFWKNGATKVRCSATSKPDDPQVFATGYSQALELVTALQEAVDMAMEALPPTVTNIDLAVVSVSSLYDGNSKPSDVVPTVLQAASNGKKQIQNLIGCTSGGFIASLANLYQQSIEDMSIDMDEEQQNAAFRACRPMEREGVPGVVVTFAILPDVAVQTFHVMGNDVPDDYGRTSTNDWKTAVGLNGLPMSKEDQNTAVMVLPSPAFQKELDDLLGGIQLHVSQTVFGGIASTVSSLSRARLFRYDAKQGESCIQTLADGCVGVVLTGDIQIETMIAQGAKPVGGVYQIVKGQECTIAAIALDETATELVRASEEQDDQEEEEADKETTEAMDAKTRMAQAYAKARIPKPVLAEANFLMRTLSDDDQAFMRKALLVGLERGGALGRTPSELARLAEGKGHAFTVHQVASAAMKDGSVTLSLGSVNIQPGQRLRFFVRESAFAKKEIKALWTGYKRRVLNNAIKANQGNETSTSFTPTGCFLFPTLDRGNKFFMGKTGFESEAVMEYLPTIPSVSGFFCNGVIGALNGDVSVPSKDSRERASLYGSASGYILVGSKSGRPIYVPGRAAADVARAKEEKAQQEAEEKRLAEEAVSRQKRIKSFELEVQAPRDEFGELILRRREVHSGRALTVSTVEWSVAEKAASPTSALEGFMWDKETEVDRFRERVPLSNLVSQWRLSVVDPTKPKPRDWLGPVKEAATKGSFVIIPECKRMEPGTGSLRKRYDVLKLSKEFVVAGAPAISVNCDSVLFGGSLEDLTKAREGASQAALDSITVEDGIVVPPILASDLLLYPYQLYKMRLAGADAVNLIVAALEPKDLVYLIKIAASLQMQTIATVTSAKQIERIEMLPEGSVDGLIVSNRNLEDFSVDPSGQQALDILASDALERFRAKNPDAVVLADGRIGIVTGEVKGGSPEGYIQKLRELGVIGAIVGAGLALDDNRNTILSIGPMP